MGLTRVNRCISFLIARKKRQATISPAFSVKSLKG